MNKHNSNGKEKTSVSSRLQLAAQELFREYGLNKVSIEEICEKAGVSKMTFYRQYRNKIDLLGSIFAAMHEKVRTQAESILNAQEPFENKFNAIMRLNEQFHQELGNKLLNDLAASIDPELKTMMEDLAQRQRDLNLRFIAIGKADGFLRSDFSDEFMLFLAEKRNEIFTDKRFATFYPNLADGVKAIRDYFYYGVTKNF